MKLFLFLCFSLQIFISSDAGKVLNSVKQQRKLLIKQYLGLFDQDRPVFPATSVNLLHISVDVITEIESLCSKDDVFASMLPNHKKAVQKIVKLLMATERIEDALKIADYIRLQTNINIYAWYHALTQWTIKDKRMHFVPKPNPVDIMPKSFIPASAMEKAKIMSKSIASEDECVIVDGSSGVDNGVENNLWYFREDIFLNGDHMFYHHSYPTEEATNREDRRAELFYYFHREALARYTAERLSNLMEPVKSLDWGVGTVFEEGYYPNLDKRVAGRNWTNREPNTPFPDRISAGVHVEDLILTGFKLLEVAERSELVLENGTILSLNNTKGIDIFGDILETNGYALNGGFYNNNTFGLHNTLHLFIAYAPNPLGSITDFGVMLDVANSFRDIIFYRLHGYINDIFDILKKQLRPYTPTGGELPLVWNGVSVTEIQVSSGINSTEVNQLTTFMNSRTFQLRKGIDHNGDFENPVPICAEHLDHETFLYKIVVNNENVNSTPATVRIFLAPRFNGSGDRFDMETQRNLLFNLDVFKVQLNQGENTIWRRSNESNLAVPWEKHFNELEDYYGEGENAEPHCGCGWPMHLLLPKGKVTGMIYDLVVMVTNGIEDAVEYEENECQAAYLYCGLAGSLYPDAKPMAYPFDRFPYSVNGSTVATLDQYIENVPNMNSVQVNITHVSK